MKKILSLIMTLAIAVAALVGCNQTPEGTSDGGKTPEQIYGEAVEALKNMTNYELTYTQSYETDFTGEIMRSETTTEYKLSGTTAYAKNVNSSAEIEEQWFVDGVMYYSSTNNKEKATITYEDFVGAYCIDVTDILIEFKSEDFEGLEFEQVDDARVLTFLLTPEKYKEYIGGTITRDAKYKVAFDKDGGILSIEMINETEVSGGYVITISMLFELKNIGKTADITIPADADSFREAPVLSTLDKSEVDINDLVESAEATDLVMLDVDGYGKIVIRLYAEVAPISVANFKKLVGEGFYDGLVFHRIIENFMIQGGGYDAEGNYKETSNIYGEFASNGFSNYLLHARGVVSMARADDYDSASSQFFIMHKDTNELDGSYAAFGFVVYGMDTVDAIATVETGSGDQPVEAVVINSAKFVKTAK